MQQKSCESNRLTQEQLKKIKTEYGVNRIWSWSRVEKFMTSKYEYFLSYILHTKADNDNSAYAPLGSICHSTIEKYYSNQLKKEDMTEEFIDGWTNIIDILNLQFNRTDENKNNQIKEKYNYDLIDFFNNHNRIPFNLKLEKLTFANINGNIFQGYIDALYKDNDNNIHIIDWKTSSQYKNKKAEEKCGQLVIYAISLMQHNIPMDRIKICWNFLKYCTITYKQKNGTMKSRDIERCELGNKLKSTIKVWLNDYFKKQKYDKELAQEEIDKYISKISITNDLSILPQEVKDNFTISDCYTYVPLTQKLIDKWVDTITKNIKDIELREKDYQETKSDKCFWDSIEEIKKESFYFANLCSYSAKLHLPYKEYLDTLDTDTTTQIFGEILNTPTSNSQQQSDDLSWLEDL